MPTIRSEFAINQFEAVLQKLAHDLPKFTRVSTDQLTIRFSYNERGKPRSITVELHGEGQWLSFRIEPKNYLDSNHIARITFSYEDNKAKIEEYLKEIMASQKPVPRFTLKKYQAQPGSNPG